MKDLLLNNYVQIILRCLAVYFFVIIAIRVFGKKELAQLSVIDLVFILLISNSVQNAMVGPDTSLGGGLLAAIALFSINFILKKIMYKSNRVNELLQGNALALIYKGEVQEAHLAAAEITINELLAAVREHGVQDIKHVDIAMLEVDGNISVISNDFQKRSIQPIPGMAHRRKHRLRGRLK
jgi:uncharacterized membrane protein YcaP (DUF421 family)